MDKFNYGKKFSLRDGAFLSADAEADRAESCMNALFIGASGTMRDEFVANEIKQCCEREEDSVIVIGTDTRTHISDETVIRIGEASGFHINPMEFPVIPYDDNVYASLVEKFDYVVALVDLMSIQINNTSICKPVEMECIYRCCRRMYEPYIKQMQMRQEKGQMDAIGKDICPTLNTFYQELLKDASSEGKALGQIVIQFSDKKKLFDSASNIPDDKHIRFIPPDDRKGIVTFVCAEYAKNRASMTRGAKTWIYMESIHYILKSEPAGRCFQKLWTNSGKFRMPVSVIGEDVIEILSFPVAASVLHGMNLALLFPNKHIIQTMNTFNIQNDMVAALQYGSDYGVLHTWDESYVVGLPANET